MSEKGDLLPWKCQHCGVVFTDAATAEVHVIECLGPEPLSEVKGRPLAEILQEENDKGFAQGRSAAIDLLKHRLNECGPCMVIHLPKGSPYLRWTILDAPPVGKEGAGTPPPIPAALPVEAQPVACWITEAGLLWMGKRTRLRHVHVQNARGNDWTIPLYTRPAPASPAKGDGAGKVMVSDVLAAASGAIVDALNEHAKGGAGVDIATVGEEGAARPRREVLLEAARPLIKFLAQSGINPHHKVIVTTVGAELLSGEITVRDESFLLD